MEGQTWGDLMPRVARAVVRRRVAILLGWVALTAVLGPRACSLEAILETAATLPGSEWDRARHAAADLAAGEAEVAVLVMRGLDPREDPTARSRVALLDSVIGAVPGVARVRSYGGPRDSLLTGRGGAVLLAVLDPAGRAGDRLVPDLRAATSGLAREWASDGVTLRWTGEGALNADLRAASARDAARAERRALPLTLLILLLAFGSAVAAGLPLVLGVLTILCALGAAGLVGRVVPLSLLLQSLVTMVGLGLGIDYALLMVRRFREELATGLTAHDAARAAAAVAGRTIVVSGVAVLLGFTGLLVIPLIELRSVGVGGIAVVLCAVATSTTLLPAVLAMLGPRIERLSVRVPGALDPALWRRWGDLVCRRPLAMAVLGVTPLLWLGWHGSRLTLGMPRHNWLPPSMESAQGLADLDTLGRGALLHRTHVLVRLPPMAGALTADGWRTLHAVHATLMRDPRVAAVYSFADLAQERAPSRLAFLATPRPVRNAYVGPDGRLVALDVLPPEGIEPQAVVEFVNDIRPKLQAAAGHGASVLVGGLPGFRADYQNAVDGWLRRVVALVIVGTFLALAIAFRSVLLPAKALALNLLSVMGAFGVVKLVFQDGNGLQLLGLTGPVSAIFPVIPTLAFCTVFGLSMDYEVFLVARVAELRRAGADERAVIAGGLAHSAPVITSASAVMIVVFGAFAFGEFLIMQILGVALAAAVLLDATLVRVVLGPALLALAGRWNWWPGDRGDHRA
jgi:RND superfamily putative drug exporter